MPTMPDFTSFGAPAVPQPSGGVVEYQPTLGRSIANAGAEVADSGRHVQQAAQILAETNQQQDQMVAQDAANKLQRRMLELQMDPQNGFRNVRGANVVGQGFVDDYQKRFDDAAADIGNALTPGQQRMFQQRSAVAGLQYRAALLGHQAHETDAFNDRTENDSIDVARRQIFQAPMDPNALAAGAAQIGWAIDQKGKRLGWDAATVADTKAKYMGAVYTDATELMIDRDPFNALAALNKRAGVGMEPGTTGIAAIDNLEAGKLVQLRHRAQAQVDHLMNQAKAEDRARITAAATATQKLQEFVLGGQLVSTQYAMELQAVTKGTPSEPIAEALVNASYAGSSFGSKTLPEQEESLRQLEAQAGQVGTSEDGARLLQHARTIHETQRKAYDDNPWAAVSRFGRMAQVPEQDMGSLDQAVQVVQQRQGLAPTVEAYAGKWVSPLQPAEAEALADKLGGMIPRDRAVWLAGIGQGLDVHRVEALAEQLDKKDKALGLALKLGSSGTTADRPVSELVLRGAQALKDKTVKKDDQALAGWRAEIANQVRGTLGSQKAEDDVIDAAYFVRAAMDQDGINAEGFKLGTSEQKAIAMVMGYPMERAGVKTLLPRGMKEDDFDKALGTYTPEVLKTLAPSGTVYLRGQPMTLDRLSASLPRFGMTRDGAGKFLPSTGGAFVTTDPGGRQPLRLTVSKP